MVSKEILSQRTDDYRGWVEAFARNHKIPMEWAEKATVQVGTYRGSSEVTG